MPRSFDVISTKGKVGFWRTIGADRTLRRSNRPAGENRISLVDNTIEPVQSAQESFFEDQDDLAGARGIFVGSVFGVLLWYAVARVVLWFM